MPQTFQGLAKFVNNPDSSDVRFLVGGAATTMDSITTEDKAQEATQLPVAMYAHTVILRSRSKHFETMFNGDWKEKSNGVISEPNISPVVFHALLFYIYTGNIVGVDKALLPDVISAAEKMELEDLSLECQAKLMEELDRAFFDKEDDGDDDNSNDGNDSKADEKKSERVFKSAVRTLLIPGLIIAHKHALPDFFKQLFDFTVGRMPIIVDYPATLAVFFENIPVQFFKQILASDSLLFSEDSVWELAFSWACCQTKTLKTVVESQLKLNVSGEMNDDIDSEAASSVPYSLSKEEADQPLVSIHELKLLKATLSPLIPAIRFTLMDPKRYGDIVVSLAFFLPTRRSLELQQFFSQPDSKSLEKERLIDARTSKYKDDDY